MTREEIHADQIARLRQWASSNGHHPDVYRRRPPRELFGKVDAR